MIKELQGGVFSFVSGVVVMRIFQMLRQLCAAAIGGLLAAGCGLPAFIANPVGVGAPTPANIASYIDETEIGSTIKGSASPVTTGEYLIASISYTNEKCHDFFDTLERFKEDSSLIDKVLTAAAAVGSPLFAASAASGTMIAKFTGILNSANQLNNNYRDIYTFKEFQEPLHTHVFDLMADFRKKNGLSTLTRSLVGVKMFETDSSAAAAIDPVTVSHGMTYTKSACDIKTLISAPTKTDANNTEEVHMDGCRMNDFLQSREAINLMIARNIATEYASLCSISTMRSIVYQALHATKSEVKAPDSTAPQTKPL